MVRSRIRLALALALLAAGCTGSTPKPTPSPSAADPSPTPSAAAPSPTEAPTAAPTPTGGAGFRLAAAGCAMSHCDPSMSDAIGLAVPAGDVGVVWWDEGAAGSNYGLGCSSNGAVAACSMGGNGRRGPYLKVYEPDGRVRWTSDRLGFFAFTSAPLVGADGGVIAADNEHILRFDPQGRVLWETEMAGGLPISPVLTASGALVTATLGGPVAAFDARTGALLETLSLHEIWEGVPGTFDTRNTPCVKGDRIFLSTEFVPDSADDLGDPADRPARLIAVDVDAGAPAGERLRVAWHFEFGARSGSSPLLMGDTIFFDGDRPSPGAPDDPRVFAVRDLGGEPELRWSHPMPGFGFASAAGDPRGGLWAFGSFDPHLIHLDERTGAELQRVDLDALIGAPGIHVPLSAMSVGTGPQDQPVLLVTAAEVDTRESWLAAVDLSTGGLLWALPYGEDLQGWGAGQWPVIAGEDGRPVVVFTTSANGIFGVGARSP